jgi:plastocyanin
MRKAGISALAVAVAAILAVTAAVALAAPAAITGKADNTFDAPTYNHDAGTVAQLLIAGSSHNATATANGPDGKPLFSSITLSTIGGSTPVNGTEYLAAGSYPFICTIHPSTMVATLVVAGTPQPRPTVTAKVLDTKLSKVVKKGQLRVQATTTGTGKASVTAKLGNAEIVTPKEISGASTQTLKLALTRKGRTKLGKAKKAKLKVESTIDFGSPATVAAKLK